MEDLEISLDEQRRLLCMRFPSFSCLTCVWKKSSCSRCLRNTFLVVDQYERVRSQTSIAARALWQEELSFRQLEERLPPNKDPQSHQHPPGRRDSFPIRVAERISYRFPICVRLGRQRVDFDPRFQSLHAAEVHRRQWSFQHKPTPRPLRGHLHVHSGKEGPQWVRHLPRKLLTGARQCYWKGFLNELAGHDQSRY